jgi:hypothetical protein
MYYFFNIIGFEQNRNYCKPVYLEYKDFQLNLDWDGMVVVDKKFYNNLVYGIQFSENNFTVATKSNF